MWKTELTELETDVKNRINSQIKSELIINISREQWSEDCVITFDSKVKADMTVDKPLHIEWN